MKKLFLVVPSEREATPPHKIFDRLMFVARPGGEISSFKSGRRYSFIVNANIERNLLFFLGNSKVLFFGESDCIDGRVFDMARHLADYIISGGEYIV